jgi:hypothetical protein
MMAEESKPVLRLDGLVMLGDGTMACIGGRVLLDGEELIAEAVYEERYIICRWPDGSLGMYTASECRICDDMPPPRSAGLRPGMNKARAALYWGCDGTPCSSCPEAVYGLTPMQRYGTDSCWAAAQADLVAKYNRFVAVL